MVKYETTLKIKARDRIPDIRTILEGLYYRKPALAKKAELFVYELVERKRVPASDWQEMQKSLSTTHQEYYTMLAKLRDAGMITKVDGEWIMSEQFANRCGEMEGIWSSVVKKWKA